MRMIRTLTYSRICRVFWASLKKPHLFIFTLSRRDSSKIPTRVIKKFIDPATIDFIIEAGCFDGTDTVSLGKLFQSAEIHAFEPILSIYEIALQNTSQMQRLHLNRLALIGDSKSIVKMFTFNPMENMHGSSSVKKPTTHLEIHPSVRLNEIIEVPAITLAKYMLDYKLSGNGLLWLDLQGAELDILSETPSILSQFKAIYTEVSTEPLYENSATIKTIDSFLRQHNFQRVFLRIFLETGNALYIRE